MKHFNFLAWLIAAGAAPLFLVLSAKADLAQMNDGAPFVIIRSNGGQITVRPTEPDGIVRVPGNAPGVQMNRFMVSRDNVGKFTIPGFRGTCARPGLRGGRPGPCFIPPRQINLPNLREGPHGVSIDNPGGDLPVSVPQRFEAMFIQAGNSPVLMEQTHGRYGIVGQNDISLHDVAGLGWVRTSGNIDVRNPQGGIQIDQLAGGKVVLQSGAALAGTIINSINGDVEWTINGLGNGPYRIISGSGLVRILVRPGVGANITAQSDTGQVVSYVDPAMANILLARPHALSLVVGGGGPQITVMSASGNVVIATAQ